MTDAYDKSFAAQFERFCAASFGVQSSKELPDKQRLAIEDAFMAGAQHGFYSGYGALDAEAAAYHNELVVFGDRIVDRYREAGLPLGARPS